MKSDKESHRPWTGRSTLVDVVRIAAVTIVMVHHMDDYAGGFFQSSAPYAISDDLITAAALSALFALSGLLAHRSLDGPSARAPSAFLRRRILRVYPPFVIALILFLAAGLWRPSPLALVENVLVLGPITGKMPPTLWFVEIIIWYYLVISVLKALYMVRGRRTENRRWSAIAQGVLMAGAVIALMLFASPDSRLFIYAPAAAIGWYLYRPDGMFANPRQLRLGSALTVLSAMVYVMTYPYGPPLTSAALTLEAFAVGWLVATVVTSPWDTPQTHPIVWALAYGSFMAYLGHRLVFRSISYASERRGIGVHAEVAILLASIPVIFIVGWVAQSFYDRAIGRVQARGNITK